jgi:succinyl-CoA synthetase beta subunit
MEYIGLQSFLTPAQDAGKVQLYEFQAKQIFESYGLGIPIGRVALTVDTASQVAKSLQRPVAVKAQVLSGGRGLSGGVRFGRDCIEVREIASKLLEMTLKGETPRALLVEERVEPLRELYAGVTWDYKQKMAVIIASLRGGVDIEDMAKNHPSDVVSTYVDPFKGFHAYQGRMIASKLGLEGNELVQYASAIAALWNIFEKHDAELVEANPLGLLKGGRLIALDAKLIIDDKSIFRQSSLLSRIDSTPQLELTGLGQRRARAKEFGIPTYVEMDRGEIGVVADGAGSGMLTLDLVSDLGGRTRVYCEMGGEATANLMENSMLVVSKVENLRAVLINLIGGLNRMDEMAIGIINFLSKHPFKIPTVVRMSGTMQDEGRRILTGNGVPFFDDIYRAARETVNLSKGD